MSDLCLYELQDNVWDEFGETDDHIVPHPGNRQGDQSSVQSNSRRKLQSEVIGVTSNADTSVKYSVPGKEKREIQSVTNNTTMLEKNTWSHTTDGVFPSCDIESTKGVPSIASDDARISSHSFKRGNVESDGSGFCADDSIMGDGCTADDNNLYSYPLDQMSQGDNDLSFFDNEQGEKDNSDLLFYGWPDIGNFEDVDRMFRNCDSTFGLQSLNNDEELCWYPPSNAAEISEDALKSGLNISGQDMGSSANSVSDKNEALQLDNEGHLIHGSNEKNVFVGTRMSSRKTDSNDPALGHSSFLHEEDTKYESRVNLMPREQINVCKNQPMHQNRFEGEKADQYLENGVSFQHYDNLKQITDMKHPCGDLSGQVCSTSDIQQLKQSAGHDSMSNVQSHYMQLDYSNHSDQISVCRTPSGSMSENSGFPSSSLKGSSYASNQLQSSESCHGLSIEIPAVQTMSEKCKNLQSSQGFLSPIATNFAKLTATSPMGVGGKVLNQKQPHCKSQIEGQNNVGGGNDEFLAELVSSNIQESSCMSTMVDDISLEAASFRQLQQVMEKLDARTKLCIRDSLYRLARSAEQRHNCPNQNVVIENGDASGGLIVEDTNKCTDFMDIETDTNPIDRSIAHLLFHRPPDPSRVPSNDSLSLRSHAMLHESVSSPKVKAEKQVCHEETLAGGEKETLITGDG